ncbi:MULTISPECIES: addiction module protein [unclassified Kaistella]|uniref:addiction module protein n=1 Tax=unclassified Kaistella TaxID=2762626 RepID=UPI0027350BE8|nr:MULTISPECIES: addiction module protein [unclassified Kaistella]MCZ2084924.1 addiction module protein [Flavobacteriales bacterium]MDP2452562.1 addiction module protein [Kaistella sp. SH11-4b]MDP2455470.1 addiction module protein [Kaistella sp. SH40-3]MDP2458374.1 addiction module protein [Kaistella sp. SH19-2b]
MNVTVEQLTEKLKTLPENFLERVWGYIDGLSEEEIDLEIPEWQKNEVRERIEEYKRNPGSLTDMNDVFSEIDRELDEN